MKQPAICAALVCRGLVAAGFAIGGSVVFAQDDVRVIRYMESAATQLDPVAQQTLPRIDGTPRRLLALRAYLRAGDGLKQRWSWSAAQIREYESSAEYRQMLADIAAVSERFAAESPGYTLYVNTEVRSLDLQLERWNSNPRVGAVAHALYTNVAKELDSYSAEPSDVSVHRFIEFLRAWRTTAVAPLAAPGLSLHGQSRALDFQVHRGTQVIAGPEVASVAITWERQGWSQRLRRAIAVAAPARFIGPLRSPNEPWHYEYVPATKRAGS